MLPTQLSLQATLMLMQLCSSLAFTGAFFLIVPTIEAQGSGPDSTSLCRDGVEAPPEGLTTDDWSHIRAAHDASRHAAVECAAGLRSHNPGQGWTTAYDDRGVTTTPDGSDAWTWGLALASFGFEGAPVDLERAASVSAEGNRVSLGWNELLTEWWVNDARGLEHGFTVHRRPHGADGCGALRFTLGVRGDLRPEVIEGRRSARFVDALGAPVLDYVGLVAFDARGRDLEAWMETTGDQLVLHVDERGAVYPLTVDPVVQTAYLKASNTDSGDGFGFTVAVSGDTVVVGASGESSNGTGVNGPSQGDNSAPSAGAVYVFRQSGATWIQEAYLKASNTDGGDSFGTSVAISGDTAVVGALHEDSNGTGVNGPAQANNSVYGAGAAYVFTRNGTTWSQEAYLKASNPGVNDWFGTSVAVSGDIIVVGAYGESSIGTGVNGPLQGDDSAPSAGAAYVFTRSGTTWSQEAYIKASNTDPGDSFGAAVAVSGDTVIVGAPLEASNGTGVNAPAQADNSLGDAGAAYVFRQSGTNWSQEAYVKASNTDVFDRLGSSVSVSGDTIVVGAPLEDSNGTGVNGPAQADDSLVSAGAAYVFSRSGTSWTQAAYLKASNTDSGDWFGHSVAVSGDTIVVGASGESSNGTGVNGPAQGDDSEYAAGAAYVFTRGGTTWSQEAYLKASNTDDLDTFGKVAVAGDTVVVGGPGEDSNGTGVNSPAQSNNSAAISGATYVFDLRSIGTNYCAAVANSTGTSASISARGSASAAANDLVLRASALPQRSFGYFLTSSTQGFTANHGGSQGNLCLGGAIGSYIGLGQVQSSGASGVFSLALDLTQHPTPTGSVAVQAGETWSFTAWYRDANPTPTSNFTDALEVLFN